VPGWKQSVVKIAIVGAGIGGMTLALSLHDAGPRSQSAEPLTTFAFRGRTEDPDRMERFVGVFTAHVRRWRAGPYPWSLLACADGGAGNGAPMG
jgi:2-polyprenyl-6-methoxyphenol hydroxylase-like FAD-dependent oxidoreductase